MADVRIFVSYDPEHDADLYTRLVEQSHTRGSGFVVAGGTESTSDPGDQRVRRRIRAADEVVCVCGVLTAESPRASNELRIAQEESKPYFLLWGRRGHMCTRPMSAKATDSMYSWTEPILRNQIAVTLQNAVPREIPESCKRPPARPVVSVVAVVAEVPEVPPGD